MAKQMSRKNSKSRRGGKLRRIKKVNLHSRKNSKSRRGGKMRFIKKVNLHSKKNSKSRRGGKMRVIKKVNLHSKKNQKGGVCRQNEICLFIKSHGRSNRKDFPVPANMSINFYTPRGHTAPAWYNDIRDVCYDVDLANPVCEIVTSGNRCPDYNLTPFTSEVPDQKYYAAKSAGLYECTPMYPNDPLQGYSGARIINQIVGETSLSVIIQYIVDNRTDNRHIQVNCNFCRGTKATTSNKFFKKLANNQEDRYSDKFNASNFNRN